MDARRTQSQIRHQKQLVDEVEYAKAAFEKKHLEYINLAITEGDKVTTRKIRQYPNGDQYTEITETTQPGRNASHSKWLLAIKFPERYSTKVINEQKVRFQDVSTPREVKINLVAALPPEEAHYGMADVEAREAEDDTDPHALSG